jgi:low affinity Fe/Cu permease
MEFSRFTRWCAHALGTPIAFLVALIVVVVWAMSGPFIGFSDTWQLIINTGTTITTGLFVFIIQNTQNHDTRAMHVKLDEIILKMENADNKYVRAETREDKVVQELEQLHEDEIKENTL